MTASSSNKRTTSTTWAWRRVKISTPPEANSAAARRASSSALPAWDPREPLSIQVVRRGGSECWWELRARGYVWRRPGHLCIEDVLQDVMSGRGGKRPDTTPGRQRRRQR